jgi:stress response protein YsnF
MTMSDTSSYGYGSTASGGATLTAFFDRRADAQTAIDRLRANGVSESCIRLTEGAGEGSSGMGSSAGMSSSTSGAGENRGFFESLGDFFFPDEDRYAYAEGLSRGGYLLTVSGLSADQHETALDILDDEGAVDIDEREQSWRSEGWTGYQSGGSVAAASLGASMGAGTTGMGSGATATTGMAETGAAFAERDVTASGDETVQVVEEQLRVGKRVADQGRVRVRSYVVETPVSEQVQLTEERVSIERRPVDRAVSATDAFQDRTIEADVRARRRWSPRRPAWSRRSACARRPRPTRRRSPTPCATRRSRSRTGPPRAAPPPPPAAEATSSAEPLRRGPFGDRPPPPARAAPAAAGGRAFRPRREGSASMTSQARGSRPRRGTAGPAALVDPP